jgi:hypothetical protein
MILLLTLAVVASLRLYILSIVLLLPIVLKLAMISLSHQCFVFANWAEACNDLSLINVCFG